MNLTIPAECPKCEHRFQIDVTKQMKELVTEQAKREAERLLPKAKEEAAEKGQ
jgi:hypothetical protein